MRPEAEHQYDPTQPLAEFLPPKDPFFEYKGLRIYGLAEIENPLITPDTVRAILDRFPDSYWQKIPLKEIHFENYEVYSAKRTLPDGSFEVIYATTSAFADDLPRIAETIGVDEILQEGDEIIARKRGLSIDDDNGGKVLHIFSSKNWDGKEDKQIDADNALFILTHELGHITWKMLSTASATNEVTVFQNLPESSLARFHAYRPIVELEFQNAGNLQNNLPALLAEEDFAVAHEHHFYWQDLNQLDADRDQRLHEVYDPMRPEETQQ